MVNKVKEYVKLHHMIEDGDTLIVAVSGGADSVCLLSVLSEWKETWNLRIICAHVNHMFRETALRDEEYVQTLCEKLGICFRVKRVNVKKLSEEEKISFEEAGRKVRYAFFRELKDEYKASKIAVAHNSDDCAETVLFHLFRGSHLKGLGGIRPVSGDIIRPLLNIQRTEIEDYLQRNHIVWQNDETNASTEYTRNYIRHEILPAAEKICSGARKRIAETAENLREAEAYLEQQTMLAGKMYCKSMDGGTYVDAKILEKEHPAIRSRLLYSVLEQVGGSAKDLTKVHVQELEKLFYLQAGKRISLPDGLYAYKRFDGVLVRREKKMAPRDICDDGTPESGREDVGSVSTLISRKELECGETVRFGLKGLGNVHIELLSTFDLKNIPQKTYTKWFDYDKIIKCAVFRKRMEGDFLTIDEKGNHKRLKEYFIQEKIPSYKRDEVWILADDNHIIWVPGYRISSHYKVSEQTKKVLAITIGGKNDE